MRLALIYSTWNLAFRGAFTFAGLWDDPRGLSGSEVAFVQYARALKAAGHEVVLYTDSTDAEFEGMRVKPLEMGAVEVFDAVIAFNDPEPLRYFDGAVRVFVQYVNSFDYCAHDMPSFVDLFVSPSEPHRAMLTGKEWPLRNGAKWQPDPDKWAVVSLACDPEEYGDSAKVPGRVIYCSSPDRGLHWLLQEWPAIKRAVPYATLRIYYRLRAWLDQWNTLGYNPALEGLRARALYIEECLRRMGPEYDITVCDAVSRRQIAQALSEAEVLAYPCDTVAWTEGFSCSTLEACAARACPVIWDCDALWHIYAEAAIVAPRGDLPLWRSAVVRALTSPQWRDSVNDRAEYFARERTWKKSTETLLDAIRSRCPALSESSTPTRTKRVGSETSSPNPVEASA